ncbi:MAG: hypothetical protein WCH44_05680 [Betaproteobacteria bacterium]
MKKLLLSLVLLCSAQLSFALAPYIQGSKLPVADLATQLTQLEKKLQAEGFTIIGRHTPKGLPQHASIVVTDPAMLEAVRAMGGSAVIASGIRVGVQSDGTVSYMNPDYWYRAYLRGQFKAAQAAAKSVQTRLAKALGEGAGFGGDVAEGDLANYRYMFGMERFDSSNAELSSHASFEDALKAVQENLSKGVAGTGGVYEVVMAQQKIAVFGVAMNDPANGEGWWVNKVGADHMAGLPYELYIVGSKVYAPYARFRIALAWPALGMGQFMGIISAPEAIRGTLLRVAGGN